MQWTGSCEPDGRAVGDGVAEWRTDGKVTARYEGQYEALSPSWLPRVGLGLKLWQGAYEGHQAEWLRWCDRRGRRPPRPRCLYLPPWRPLRR